MSCLNRLSIKRSRNYAEFFAFRQFLLAGHKCSCVCDLLYTLISKLRLLPQDNLKNSILPFLSKRCNLHLCSVLTRCPGNWEREFRLNGLIHLDRTQSPGGLLPLPQKIFCNILSEVIARTLARVTAKSVLIGFFLATCVLSSHSKVIWSLYLDTRHVGRFSLTCFLTNSGFKFLGYFFCLPPLAK